MFFGRAFLYPEEPSEYTENLKTLADGAEPQEGPLHLCMLELGKTPHTELQAEFTRLFILSYPKTPCPPFESVYREGTLMGNAAEKVAGIYEKWGIESSEMVDHVGSELEFMAFLLGMPQEEEIIKEEKHFFRDHIATWIPKFCKDIRENTAMEFFKKLSTSLENFLKKEARAFWDES